jgi:dTDP-4-amino-4,6-dideoxygalactose transaminase
MIEYENLAKLNAPFHQAYEQAFSQLLKDGWFILGKKVESFEVEFANYCQSNFCVGVASGLDALTLALHLLGLERGSEVIVPSNTYIATILSILHHGLKPILVEPDLATYNICPQKIEEAITPKTRAIMVVHLYGKLCNMEKINAIAQKHHLKVIEDAAQAHGASYQGKKAGTWGDLAAFSFYPTKNLGCLGDGGAITTQSQEFDAQLRTLRNYGSKVKYQNERIGFNSRLDEIQAIFLSIKLQKLDEINEHKRSLAKLYIENLKEDFIKPALQEDYYDIYHIFNIRHEKRDNLKEYLLKHSIKTDIHYPIPPHKQQAIQHIFEGKAYPISTLVHQTTLSLPISFCHTTEDILQIIDTMNKF